MSDGLEELPHLDECRERVRTSLERQRVVQVGGSAGSGRGTPARGLLQPAGALEQESLEPGAVGVAKEKHRGPTAT